MRLLLGIAAGLLGWFAVVVIVSFALRALAPDAAAALAAHATVGAQATRLAISFGGSLFGGWLAAAIARTSHAALIAGVLLLLGWGYYHLTMIWDQFPVWYHVTFLISLPLLAFAGARLVPVRQPR